MNLTNGDGLRHSPRTMDLRKAVVTAASTASASVVSGGGEDSFLRVWDGTNGKELAVFGAK